MAEGKQVLNAAAQEAAPPAPASLPAAELAARLQRLMLRMKAEHMAEDGRGVAYTALAQSPLFEEYLQLAGELGSCDISSLSSDELKAFFISIPPQLASHTHHLPLQALVWLP